MLTFVGLGLYDERSVTVRGREAIAAADRVFAEFYTSRLTGSTVADLEATHDVDIEVRERAGVERDPGPILDAAERDRVAFLVAGDPMVSTTHVDLRLRAESRGIGTQVLHGTTAQAAASSLTGLQNYRFGKATTLPFERSHGTTGVPESVLDTLADNRERGLHTLVYLDIDRADDDYATGGRASEDYMTGDHAARLLSGAGETGLAVVVGRAGSDDPTVVADSLSSLAGQSFGPPLHLLVCPGDLHPLERDALETLAGAPPDVLPPSYSRS
jgi:diphthine synthase